MKRILLVGFALALSFGCCGSAIAGVSEVDLSTDSNFGSWWFFHGSDSIFCGIRDGYTIYNPDGELIDSGLYESLENAGYGYVSAVVAGDGNDEGVNNRALIDVNGLFRTDFCYGFIAGESDKWAYGVVIEESPKSDSLYEGTDGNFYKPVRVDIFFNDALVAQIEGTDFTDGEICACGNYLMIETNAGSGIYTCFDKNGDRFVFDSNEKDVQYLDKMCGTYKKDGTVYHISGVPLFTADCPLTADDVVVPYAISTDSMSIVDLQGNIVCTPGIAMMSLQSYDAKAGLIKVFAMSSSGQPKYGLIDLTGRIILPPEYDWIGDGDSLARYGCILIGVDGKYGYATTDGSIVVEPAYGGGGSLQNNLWTAVQDIDGTYRVVSARNGLLDGVYEYVSTPSCSTGSPFIYLKNQDGEYGIIDYLGNVILPFGFEGGGVRQVSFSYVDGAKFIVGDEDGGKTAVLYTYFDDASSKESWDAEERDTSSMLSDDATEAANTRGDVATGFSDEPEEATPEEATDDKTVQDVADTLAEFLQVPTALGDWESEPSPKVLFSR